MSSYPARLDADERQQARRDDFAACEEDDIRRQLRGAYGMAAVDVWEQITGPDFEDVMALVYNIAHPLPSAPAPSADEIAAARAIVDKAIEAAVRYRTSVADARGRFEDDEPDEEEALDDDGFEVRL